MVTDLWARIEGELDDLVGKVTGFTWVKHTKLAMPRGGYERGRGRERLAVGFDG